MTKRYAFYLRKLLCLIVPPVDFVLFKFPRSFVFFLLYFFPSSDVNFLALDFLINPKTSAQTHVLIYMDLCGWVQKTARLAAGTLYRLRGRTRYSYIRTLRHYARYTLDNMVFILNVQFISSSRTAHEKPKIVFSGNADGR